MRTGIVWAEAVTLQASKRANKAYFILQNYDGKTRETKNKLGKTV